MRDDVVDTSAPGQYVNIPLEREEGHTNETLQGISIGGDCATGYTTNSWGRVINCGQETKLRGFDDPSPTLIHRSTASNVACNWLHL